MRTVTFAQLTAAGACEGARQTIADRFCTPETGWDPPPDIDQDTRPLPVTAATLASLPDRAMVTWLGAALAAQDPAFARARKRTVGAWDDLDARVYERLDTAPAITGTWPVYLRATRLTRWMYTWALIRLIVAGPDLAWPADDGHAMLQGGA